MKIRLTLIIIASFLLFQGASPWEGSAAVAPDGELPTTGFYIATNAFPKNTVVDITNIENGKKTRVIVSDTLTSPGLLAVVSREAAELIGMRAGSISRLRMIQPADPMAYMRFTENMVAGNPEYDSGNVIDEEKLVADVYKEDSYKTPDVTNQPAQPNQPTQTVQPVQVAETTAKPPAKPPAVPGYIVDEPEWGGNGRLQIVDVPGFMVDPAEQPPYNEDNTKKEESVQEETKQEELKATSHQIAENRQEDVVKDVSPKTDEEPPKEVIKDVPEFVTEVPSDEVIKDVSPWQEKAEVVTTPQQPETEAQKQSEQQILELVETSPNPPPTGVYGIDPSDIIASIMPERTDKRANTNTPPTLNLNPLIRTIDRLDRGKYYVQVAALPADLIESTLMQIDRSFSPAVFKGADNVYRILIGPLNQGESAAVLVRFKSIGYKDAFVRIGR